MLKRILFLLAVSAICISGFAAGTSDVNARVASQGLLLTMLAVFWAGFGVSLTPCVYPMIPITLSIIGARSVDQKPLVGFLRSSVFVLGIALVYSILGLIVARSDMIFGFALQSRWFLITIALFFVIMGLSMLGWFTIQMPARFAGRLQSGANRGGYVGAFLLGMVTGVVASPCGSPVLLGILAFAAQTGKAGAGFTLLFTYAIGMGMLFLVLGTFPSFLSRVPKSGAWMEDIKKFLGVILIGVGYYYIRTILPPLVYWLGVVALCLGTGFIMASAANKRRSQPALFAGWGLVVLCFVIVALYAAILKVPPALQALEKEWNQPDQMIAHVKTEMARTDALPSAQKTRSAETPQAGDGLPSGSGKEQARASETRTDNTGVPGSSDNRVVEPAASSAAQSAPDGVGTAQPVPSAVTTPDTTAPAETPAVQSTPAAIAEPVPQPTAAPAPSDTPAVAAEAPDAAEGTSATVAEPVSAEPTVVASTPATAPSATPATGETPAATAPAGGEQSSPAGTATPAATAAGNVTATWINDEAKALAETKRSGKPLLIDFGAKWCVACQELEEKTFSDPKVQEVLKKFVTARIDLTQYDSKNTALLKKYGSKQMPTVAFVSGSGELLSDLILLEFEPPDKFVERLNKVLEKK